MILHAKYFSSSNGRRPRSVPLAAGQLEALLTAWDADQPKADLVGVSSADPIDQFGPQFLSERFRAWLIGMPSSGADIRMSSLAISRATEVVDPLRCILVRAG
jgi:hypothetical protein